MPPNPLCFLSANISFYQNPRTYSLCDYPLIQWLVNDRYPYQDFPYLGDGGSPPHQPKIYSFPHPPHQIFIPSRPKVNSAQQKNKNVIFSCSHCSCTILVLISYSFETQVMLILILIDVQYSQNAVFSFERSLYCQNHFSSGSLHLEKKSPRQCSLLFGTKSGKLLKF